MNTPITATSIICTCGACPTQYEIKLSDGRMMYFRYRWGYLSIRVSPQETTDIMDAVGGEEIIGEQIGDGLDGDMEREDACIWIGRAIEKLNPCSTLTDEELQREAERGLSRRGLIYSFQNMRCLNTPTSTEERNLWKEKLKTQYNETSIILTGFSACDLLRTEGTPYSHTCTRQRHTLAYWRKRPRGPFRPRQRLLRAYMGRGICAKAAANFRGDRSYLSGLRLFRSRGVRKMF